MDTNKKRLLESARKLQRASMKRQRAREERIWIQKHPEINILNYPYYKLKRKIKGLLYKK